MRGKRGLGGQAPAVLAAQRQAPGVLARIGAPASPETQAIRALQSSNRKLLDQESRLLADLADALDGWEAVAGASDQDRIDAMRKRWGIAGTAPDDQDLTDAAG